MTDADEEPQEDAGLVRPYVIAGGTTVPEDDGRLLLITLVTAAGQPSLPMSASPEKQRLRDLCSGGYLSVAELAGYVQLPLGIVRVLLAEMMDAGHIQPRETPRQAQQVDVKILEEVLHGLRSLAPR